MPRTARRTRKAGAGSDELALADRRATRYSVHADSVGLPGAVASGRTATDQRHALRARPALPRWPRRLQRMAAGRTYPGVGESWFACSPNGALRRTRGSARRTGLPLD